MVIVLRDWQERSPCNDLVFDLSVETELVEVIRPDFACSVSKFIGVVLRSCFAVGSVPKLPVILVSGSLPGDVSLLLHLEASVSFNLGSTLNSGFTDDPTLILGRSARLTFFSSSPVSMLLVIWVSVSNRPDNASWVRTSDADELYFEPPSTTWSRWPRARKYESTSVSWCLE